MKKLMVVLLILLLIAGCSQQINDKEETEIDDIPDVQEEAKQVASREVSAELIGIDQAI